MLETGAVMAHELGHNMGLSHSSVAACSRALRPACGYGAERRRDALEFEYGGDDIMGLGDGAFPLSPVHKWQLGLLKPEDVMTVDARTIRSMTVTLSAWGDHPTHKALKIIGTNRRTTWWISYAIAPRCVNGKLTSDGCALLDWGSEPGIHEAIRVHIGLGGGRSPHSLLQRTENDARSLSLGVVYEFPGGTLTVTALTGGTAVIDVTTGTATP